MNTIPNKNINMQAMKGGESFTSKKDLSPEELLIEGILFATKRYYQHRMSELIKKGLAARKQRLAAAQSK